MSKPIDELVQFLVAWVEEYRRDILPKLDTEDESDYDAAYTNHLEDLHETVEEALVEAGLIPPREPPATRD